MLLCSTTAIASPFRVVIDAGHGGANGGAPGLAGAASEKWVTLAVARALADELRGRGLEVVLTRDRDEHLSLLERVRRANAVEPDCFVSLHAHAASERSRRGVATWVLAPDAAEPETRHAAGRARDDVRSLLKQLQLLDTARAAAQLARTLQSELVAATGAVDRGVRQHGYDRFAAVSAPAVLVEIGALDHPIEGAALLDPVQQRRIAAALASGIARFGRGLDGSRVASRR